MFDIQKNIPLAQFTTFNVGGNARYFIEAKTTEDIVDAIKFAKDNNLQICVLGGGSNVLISDDGFNGLVILIKIKGIIHDENNDGVIVRAGAGEDWHNLIQFCVLNGLAGLETLSGIPGTVGGAPVQNIGAYGSEVSSSIKQVTAYDLEKNSVVRLTNKEMEFGYRKSIFNSKFKNRYIILEVVFQLNKNSEPNLSYQDLKTYFIGKPKPSLKEVHQAVLEIRARKGMIIDPNFESYKSAGSFFKNSVVSKEVFESVRKETGLTETGWFWDQPNNMVKVSSAKLIELSGFKKGDKFGEAGISPKHTLSLINLRSAKAVDIINLAKKIIEVVNRKFGVKIEPEVLLVGFEKNPFI